MYLYKAELNNKVLFSNNLQNLRQANVTAIFFRWNQETQQYIQIA